MAQIDPRTVATDGITQPPSASPVIRAFLIAVVGLGVFDTPVEPQPTPQATVSVRNTGGGWALNRYKKRPPIVSGIDVEEECPLPIVSIVVEYEAAPEAVDVSQKSDIKLPPPLIIKRES